MKLESAKSEGFKPIKLTITFETLDELKVFYGMTNQSITQVEEGYMQGNFTDDLSGMRIDRVVMPLFKWTQEELRKLI